MTNNFKNIMDDPIPENFLVDFQKRMKREIFDLITTEFRRKEVCEGFSLDSLAYRLNQTPEQISDLLLSPDSWTLETISDLTLAIFNGKLEIGVVVGVG